MNIEKQPSLIESVSGAVLAGGKSARMGTDKRFVRLQRRTLVEMCVETLRRCFARNVIVADKPDAFEYLELPIFEDEVPDLGPLGGVVTALQNADRDAVFVVACDMPFLNAELIRGMAGMIGEFDAVVPKVGGRYEPLHAVYRRSILPEAKAQIALGDLSLNQLLGKLDVKALTEAELEAYGDWQTTFVNLNTPEELEQARQFLEERSAHGK